MYIALLWMRKALVRTNYELPYYLRGVNNTLNTKAAGNHGVVRIYRALLLSCRALLRMYRALLRTYRALLLTYRTLLWTYWCAKLRRWFGANYVTHSVLAM